MHLQEWKDSGDFFDYGGHPIFFHRQGSGGEMLLCLHGFPASSFDYNKIWDDLASKFTVVSHDMIGYGFSAKPVDFSYTTFDQVDLLQALLRHLDLRRIHILAHDYGNTITQELLARDAEGRLDFEIASVCFLNGALFPETHRPILAQKLLISPIGFLFGRLIPDSIFKKSLSSVFGKKTQPTDEEMEEFLTLFKYNNGKRIAHKLIRYMAERTTYRERWVAPLQNLRQPFVFINGSADPVSGAHLIKRFRELIPDQTDIIEMPDIGHFPHFECPDAVLQAFFKFHLSGSKL